MIPLIVMSQVTDAQIWLQNFLYDYEICSSIMMTKHSMHLTPENPGRLSSLQGQEKAMVGLFIMPSLAVPLWAAIFHTIFHRLKWNRMLTP